MACPAVHTGGRFVADMLGYVDCQAQTIGAYGFGALANPHSPVSLALNGLLTVFVALLGIRMLLGPAPGGRDIVGAALKVGVVVTLATSWPAWRVIGYDLVLHGPAEISSVIGAASGLPGSGNALGGRLQGADDQIVILTILGTGRSTGGATRSDAIGDSFRGVALNDAATIGYGRIAFLVGVLGSTAVVRLGAGLLLALAPLMAGLLLFAGTRDLFMGWLRALAACAISACLLPLVFSVELGVMEPWLHDAVAQRNAQVLAPSFPTELVVIALAFGVLAFALLGLVACVAFFSGGGGRWLTAWHGGHHPVAAPAPGAQSSSHTTPSQGLAQPLPSSRVGALADALTQTMRREDLRERTTGQPDRTTPHTGGDRQAAAPPADMLGNSFRTDATRRGPRRSASSEQRDLA